MRMSEFESPENDEGKDFSPFFLTRRPTVPDDFTAEDLAFAAELHALFSPEEENLPPCYVQTLLDADDQRFEPVARGFEYTTNAHVFRRLKLRRQLFCPHTSFLQAVSMSVGDASLRRSALAMVGTFMLIMLLTVAFTGSSFASGVAILLHGNHKAGVYLIDKYPSGLVHSPTTSQPETSLPAARQVSLLSAQQQLQFPMYWPGYNLPEYSLEHINLYVGLDQQWADGPMLEFEYHLPASASSAGNGGLWIREFKPRTDVLQLVEEGAAVPLEVDESGTALAIYVNGQWSSGDAGGPVWIYGNRSELIYQINGVVFWIAGDQRDGIGEKELMAVAQGLALNPPARHIHIPGDVTSITRASEENLDPFSSDVIILFPGNSAFDIAPYYISVTSYQPPKNAH